MLTTDKEKSPTAILKCVVCGTKFLAISYKKNEIRNTCSRECVRKGWAKKRLGAHLTANTKRKISQRRRILDEDRYIVDCGTGCWNYVKCVQGNGYGRMGIGNNKAGYAHRYFYEKYIGEIPTGLTIDHKCMNRRCVNPAHLEAVTIAENIRRARRYRRPCR